MPKPTSIKSTHSKKSNVSPKKPLPLDRSVISRLISEMGRKGGLKGGKARAAALTKDERREIARRAAQARWSPAVSELGGFEAQKRAFQAISSKALAAYDGLFVVSRNGRIVDSDENLSELTRRFFPQHGDVDVYVTRIGRRPETIATPFVKR